MGVVLTASAVWCALSVLFAGAHCRWVRYAPAWVPPLRRASSPGTVVTGRRDDAPEGADVSEFFRSWDGGSVAWPSRGIPLAAARS